MKELRIFYNKSGIIWTSGLEGEGKFPLTVGEELKSLPKDTECIEITEPPIIDAFMSSDKNFIQDGKLVIGEPSPVPEPEPVRDLAAEIDELKAKIADIEKKVK